MRTLPKTLAQGQAGVYTVAAQLLLRGVTPCFPCVDLGADVVTYDGNKLQVKSCHAHFHAKYYGGLAFYPFCLGKRVTVKHGRRESSQRMFSEECDFVVLWGIEQNRFWIIPAAILDGHSTCIVGPESAYSVVDVEAVKQLIANGIPYREVAKQQGVSLGTAYRIGSGEYCDAKLSSKIRDYENRWDLIIGNERTMQEAEAVISASMEEFSKEIT